MATRTISTAGGNWNNTATWDEGVVPTSADDVVARGDGTSGNVTVNVTSACQSIVLTNYVGTLAINALLDVFGTVTFVAGMTITSNGQAASQMRVNTTATLTSGGLTIPVTTFLFSGTAQTYTLGDNWTFSGAVSFTGTTSLTVNSNQLILLGGGNIGVPGVTGTTTIVLAGTGGFQGNGVVSVNALTINTAGTITLTSAGTPTINFNTGTFTYTAGTIAFGAGTNARLTCAASTTLDVSGINWPNITLRAGTMTLSNDLITTGELRIDTGTVTLSGATQKVYVGGNLVINQALTGTSEVILNGTGSWTAGAFTVTTNLTIDTSGTITIPGTVRYANNTLKYVAGTVEASNGTLELRGGSTLDTSTVIWGTISQVVSATHTLSSNLNTVDYSSTAGITMNGFSLYITGNMVFGGAQNNLGTTTFIISGTGRQYWFASSGFLRNNLIIDCTGPFIITNLSSLFIPSTTATNNYNTGTITYLRGKVDGSTATLALNTCTILGLNKVANFKAVTITSAATITTDEFFSGTAKQPTTIQPSAAGNYTITFTDGFEKLAKFVKIFGMTLTNTATSPGSLLIVTNRDTKGFNNRNVGNIRYINQLPNGIPTKAPSISDEVTFLPGGLLSDPAFI